MGNTHKLHLVLGGQVDDPQGLNFTDLNKVHLVGVYPNEQEATNAWRQESQKNVDDAMTKYAVVHLHKLLEPEE